MCASCVELVTFDQLRQRYPQLEQHRIAPSGGAFCRAERLKGGGAAGTYAMPRPMAPTGEKHFFGFYLTQRRLLLAEDGEFLRGLADDLEAGTPAQALAELFTRLLQEDMPTLQKYEKRLTALEEALMQDQAQDRTRSCSASAGSCRCSRRIMSSWTTCLRCCRRRRRSATPTHPGCSTT